MPVEFKMPDPGEGIHEAEILEVNVAKGDSVEEGQAVLLVETEKASFGFPSGDWAESRIIRVKEGDLVAVGQVPIVLTE